MQKKNVLVFKHMPSQNPGIFRELSESQGVAFFEIDLHAGDQIPDISSFDGLWVMGGSMNVWEEREHPWLIAEKQAIRLAVHTLEMPFLGICLGHQLLADIMGGMVTKSGNHEIGLFEIQATAAGLNHPLLRGLPDPSLWVNVHIAEVTEPPPDAIILARSETCQNHIMQVGNNAYSCQFHPEVCGHTVEDWLKIPGIPEAFEELLGAAGLTDFESSISCHLPIHNLAAFQLFENWCNLTLH